MTLEQVKELFQTTEMKELCQQNGVERLSVFGSTARNEATEQSDLDLLISFSSLKKLGLLEFIAFEDKLAEATKKKVDLMMKSSLSGRRGENIKQDVKVIYAPLTGLSGRHSRMHCESLGVPDRRGRSDLSDQSSLAGWRGAQPGDYWRSCQITA